MTPKGKKLTKLDQILLNGNNIALLVPGGKPDHRMTWNEGGWDKIAIAMGVAADGME